MSSCCFIVSSYCCIVGVSPFIYSPSCRCQLFVFLLFCFVCCCSVSVSPFIYSLSCWCQLFCLFTVLFCHCYFSLLLTVLFGHLMSYLFTVLSVSVLHLFTVLSVSVLYFYLIVLSFNLFTVLSASVLHFFTISCQCQFYIFILLFCRFILLLCRQCQFFHFHSLCLFSQLHFPSSVLFRRCFTVWSLFLIYLTYPVSSIYCSFHCVVLSCIVISCYFVSAISSFHFFLTLVVSCVLLS